MLCEGLIKMEPICYNCKHRGCVVNSRHSSCGHPEALKVEQSGELLMILFEGYVKHSRVHQVTNIKVEAEEQGILGGWFMWPWNFDPLWLKSCSGFEVE